MLDDLLPHKCNKKMKTHPDYGIRIIEEVACRAIKQYTKEIEKIFGIPVSYSFKTENIEEKGETSDSQIIQVGEMFTTYSMLPALLSTYTNKNYHKVFDENTDKFPIKLFLTSSYSFIGTHPVLHSSNNFGALLNIVDYSVEEFVNKTIINSLLYGREITPFFTIKDNPELQEEIFRVINNSNLTKIEADFSLMIKEYESIVKNAMQGNQLGRMENKPIESYFENIPSDMMSLYEIIHENSEIKTPLKMELTSNPDELMNYQQPETSATERYKVYLRERDKKSRMAINSGNSESGSRLSGW